MKESILLMALLALLVGQKSEASNGVPNDLSVKVFVTYQCEACYQLYHGLKNHNFDKATQVEFVPAISWPSWRLFAKLHLLVDKIERPELHAAIFKEIHINKAKNKSQSYWENWLKEQGVDGETFKETYFSHEINATLAAIETEQKEQAISTVPTIITSNGKKLEPSELLTTANTIKLIEDRFIEPER